LLALLLICLATGAACAVYWFQVARWQESTDDAYVAGLIVHVTPQVAGTVTTVFVDDTDTVEAGEVLVALDDADGRITLEQAEAALAHTVREVRALYVNNDALRAQIAARQAEVDRLGANLARRTAIADSGAVPREEIDHARESLRAARAALRAAREQLKANRALTLGASIENHPKVLEAAARVEEAWLAWARSRIVAPVAGQVAKRGVQTGQRVTPGTPLMTVIPLDRLWVDANFKEVQLGRMRIGQPVILTADYYGADIRYRGRVAGLSAGTGSAFALLPAQNATGNWIKVVQRVPVRVELEPEDLAAHPLRIGLSMQVTVDIRDNGGAAASARTSHSAATANRLPSDEALRDARARIADIIRRNDVPAARTSAD
jgi:membrane fusion protein (multidrug efflux system)